MCMSCFMYLHRMFTTINSIRDVSNPSCGSCSLCSYTSVHSKKSKKWLASFCSIATYPPLVHIIWSCISWKSEVLLFGHVTLPFRIPSTYRHRSLLPKHDWIRPRYPCNQPNQPGVVEKSNMSWFVWKPGNPGGFFHTAFVFCRTGKNWEKNNLWMAGW